jgi:hypothetical protein
MHVAYLKIVKKWYNQGLSVKKYEWKQVTTALANNAIYK